MNSDFHYYALYFLCLRAGFPEERADRIALSSQLVDEALLDYDIDDGDFSYRCKATQNYLFWSEGTLRDIYLPFHFIPGSPEAERLQRADGRISPWAVTENSPLAKELLVAALRSGSDCRLGIALHAYADTWAHQHFSGRLEDCNRIDQASALPPAGHLQALKAPDQLSTVWEDTRLKPQFSHIDNSLRFREAARKIFRYLRTSLRGDFADEELHLDELCRVWAQAPADKAERAASFSVDLDLPPYDRAAFFTLSGVDPAEARLAGSSGYDRLAWAKAALAQNLGSGSGPIPLSTHGRFRNSPFHHWNEAAREHRSLALSLFAKEGLL